MIREKIMILEQRIILERMILKRMILEKRNDKIFLYDL